MDLRRGIRRVSATIPIDALTVSSIMAIGPPLFYEQFFITLKEAPTLNLKHVVFGKVAEAVVCWIGHGRCRRVLDRPWPWLSYVG